MTEDQIAAMREGFEQQRKAGINVDWFTWQIAWADARAVTPASIADTARVKKQLSNLLARIHRDGGHYEVKHGTDKAVEDADLIVAKMNAAADTAEMSQHKLHRPLVGDDVQDAARWKKVRSQYSCAEIDYIDAAIAKNS